MPCSESWDESILHCRASLRQERCGRGRLGRDNLTVMDPTNSVVKLCVLGMHEEGKGNREQAAQLFRRAWEQGAGDLERCIAAHYVARHQPTPELALHWNQAALDCALRVADASVEEFFASLYLNLAKSYEDLGNREKARQLYEYAGAKLVSLPPGAYREIVQDGVTRGLRRVGTQSSV